MAHLASILMRLGVISLFWAFLETSSVCCFLLMKGITVASKNTQNGKI